MHSTALLAITSGLSRSLISDIWKSAVEDDGVGAVNVGDGDERLIELVVATILEEFALVFWVGILIARINVSKVTTSLCTGDNLPSTLAVLLAETDNWLLLLATGGLVAESPWLGVWVRVDAVEPETVKTESKT